MKRGSCLCGAVSFEVSGPLGPPDACHCTRCRKLSGHCWASTDVPRTAVTIQGEGEITWYPSSEKVRRGFCRTCGAQLFWDPLQKDTLALAMGAFDSPTETKLAAHLFVENKGDYYDIADGVPQHA